jgi:hypothetical protein
MSSYQRPWWLVVNKPAGLVTTVKEEMRPGERVYLIRGEPLVQGLAWLTWGPAAALVVVLLLAGLALGLNVKEQTAAVRGLAIVAFLGLPALTWGVASVIVTRLSSKHLQAERQAEAQECLIRLNQNQGELRYRTTAHTEDKRLDYADIHQARVAPSVGSPNSQAVRLTLETTAGPVILLDETLGTQVQKIDLAYEIQQALRDYSDK